MKRNIDVSTVGTLATEFKSMPGETAFYVEAGGKRYSGMAVLVIADGVATLRFPPAKKAAKPKKKAKK